MAQITRETVIPPEMASSIALCALTAAGLLGFAVHEKAQIKQPPPVLSSAALQPSPDNPFPASSPAPSGVLIAPAYSGKKKDPVVREAVVQEGQGVLAALGDKHPILTSKATVAVYRVRDKRFSLEELLKANPVVHPGEKVRAEAGVPDSYKSPTSIKPLGSLYRSGTK